MSIFLLLGAVIAIGASIVLFKMSGGESAAKSPAAKKDPAPAAGEAGEAGAASGK